MGGVGWAMMENECACACWACDLLTEYADRYRPPPPEVLLAACCRKLRIREAAVPMWPREHDACDWRTENWDTTSSAANAAKKAGLGSVKASLTRRDTELHLDGDRNRSSEYFKSYCMPRGAPPLHLLSKTKTNSTPEEDTSHIPDSHQQQNLLAETHGRPQPGLGDPDCIYEGAVSTNGDIGTPKDLFQCSSEYKGSLSAIPHIKKRSLVRPRSALRDDNWWFSNEDVTGVDSEKSKHYSEYMECFKAVPEEKFREISQERRWSKTQYNSSQIIVDEHENTLYQTRPGVNGHGESGATMDFSSEYKEKFQGLPPLEKRAHSRPRTALREIDRKVKYGDPVSNSEWKTRRWVGGVRDGTRGKESSGYNTPVPPTQRRSRLDSWEAAQSSREHVSRKENSRSLAREQSMTRGRRLSAFSKISNTANEQQKRPPFRLVVNNQDTRDLHRGRSVSPSRLRWQMNAERENNSFVVLERTP